MSRFSVWVKASRLPAQLFIFPSLLLGQAAHVAQGGSFSWLRFALLFLLGCAIHFFIVYANDYADYETDQLNTTFTPFTGGSRVLIEGLLTRQALLKGTFVMLGVVAILTTVLAVLSASLQPLIWGLGGLLLMQAYSFKPIHLSYRGLGESLQMLGVGLVLPLLGFTAQGGAVAQAPWVLLLVLLPAQLAMAFGTSLPDEPSDRLSRKRTSAVLLGVRNAALVMVTLFIITWIGVAQAVDLPSLPPVFVGLILTNLVWIGLQTYFAWKPSTLPGTQAMFFLTALSILANTWLVFVLSAALFQGAFL
jgi:1,4-dihydroxy-2-naphthoate octaprenyltransferase